MDIDKLTQAAAEIVRVHKAAPGDCKGFDLLDLMHNKGSPVDALLYVELFMPGVIEVDGHILLKRTLCLPGGTDRFHSARRLAGSSRASVEHAFNTVELPYLFGGPVDLDQQEYVVLAEIVRESWVAWLCHVFPDREFAVEVIPPTAEDSSCYVRFAQQQHSSNKDAGTRPPKHQVKDHESPAR